MSALSYIDDNLCSDIKQEDIAAACYCSLSGLQKLFTYVLHFSVKEYIEKRRISCAARDITDGGKSITETCFKYRYNSPEVFSRAFQRVWSDTPSVFKHKWKFTGLFPKIVDFYSLDGKEENMRRRVDISEFYDVLKSMKDTWVICFDVVGLMPINQISHELGDRAILEAAARIDKIADESMLLFRIGGDEFALVTGLEDKGEVTALADKILAMNGESITHKDNSVPLSVRAGATKLEAGNLRYHELYTKLQKINDEMRDPGKLHIG